MISTLLSLLPYIAIAALVLSSMVIITPQQHARVVETFGKYSGPRYAGLSFKAPWPIQTASKPISLQVQELSQDVAVKSSDNAFVVVPIRVQYQIDAKDVAAAHYKLDDPQKQITSYIVNQVRSTASDMDFDQLFRSKSDFESEVDQTLSERMSGYGFDIVNVLVDDPQPSEDLRRSFDRVLASIRLREAAENEGEAERIKRVKSAEAEKEAMELKAQAYANFRKIVAEGNAEAVQEFVEGTGIPADRALDFFTEINQMEALRDAAASGGRTVLVAGQTGGEKLSAALLSTLSPEAGKSVARTPEYR